MPTLITANRPPSSSPPRGPHASTPTARWILGLGGVLLALSGCHQTLRQPHADPAPGHVTVVEDFLLDEPPDHWTFRTPELWRIAREGDRRFLQMAVPPARPMLPGVRRPQESAILGKHQFRSFSLQCMVRVDRDPAIAARDAVIIFALQDDTHFYYAHLSGVSNEWHNTLVRVDGETRKSLLPPGTRPPPAMTDAAWHKIDVLRDFQTGLIQVYVDAVDENARPLFEVTDRTYEWGHVGLGSFDDHASFTRLRIEGEAR